MRSTAPASKRGAVKREPQQVERLVAVFLQRAQRAAEVIAAGVEAELDRFALQPIVEGLASRSPAPSSSRLAAMLATPGLSAGSCAAPPENGEVDRDQRDGGIAHQPDFDAARTDDPLDLGRRAGASSEHDTAPASNAAAARRKSNADSRAFLLASACP